jgi:hypothetical protein
MLKSKDFLLRFRLKGINLDKQSSRGVEFYSTINTNATPCKKESVTEFMMSCPRCTSHETPENPFYTLYLKNNSNANAYRLKSI